MENAELVEKVTSEIRHRNEDLVVGRVVHFVVQGGLCRCALC